MWEIIRKNQIKSVIALVIMAVSYSIIYGIIFAIIFAYLLYGKHSGKFIIPVTWSDLFIFGIIISLGIFIYNFISKKNKPYEISGSDIYKVGKYTDRKLYNVVEEMAIASGLRTLPDVYIWDSNVLNAYACGLTPNRSSIVVSKGLLKLLSRDELQGVIAHEMSHIINRDTMYLLCSGAIYLISSGFTSCFYNCAKNGRSNSKSSGLMAILALISYLGQCICFLLFMFISRKREYIADACASQFTRFPKGLADALLKIEKSVDFDSDFAQNADKLVKASFIVPVEKGDNIKSTHPSTENRIKILLNMTSADYRAYEKEFRKINNSGLIPKSVINSSKNIPVKNMPKEELNLSVMQACSLNNKVVSDKQVKLIKENKQVLKNNIRKNIQIEDFVRDLAGYIVINCDCGTFLKVPPSYKNKIVICPHCSKKHIVNSDK